MSLVKQTFKHNDIKLSFYSLIHPTTGILWITGNDIVKTLRFPHNIHAIHSFVYIEDQMDWLVLTRSLSIKTPKNWHSQSKIMITENGLYSLITNSRLGNLSSFKSFVRETVITKCRQIKDNSYAKALAIQEDRRLSGIEGEIYGHFYMATTRKFKIRNVYIFGSTVNLNYRLSQLNVGEYISDFRYYLIFNTKHFRSLEKFMTQKYKDSVVFTDFFIINEPRARILKICKDFAATRDHN